MKSEITDETFYVIFGSYSYDNYWEQVTDVLTSKDVKYNEE